MTPADGGTSTNLEDPPVPSNEEKVVMESQQTASGRSAFNFKDWFEAAARKTLPRKYRLAVEEDARKYSMRSLQFVVACSAISTKMLNPNYPLMVSPGGHPDSFPDTEPFEFNSATYFLPMMSLLGVAISSIFLGQLSDKVGRKKPLLVMAIISGIGNIVKFYSKDTFWGFCISNLAFGFFLGNLPIAMAVVGDIFVTKRDKERELGNIVGIFVMGNSGGGVIAILMGESGLFAPLWIGAGLMFLAAALLSVYFIEPGDKRLLASPEADGLVKSGIDDDDDNVKRPETINQVALWNVVGGALADNFGSTALFPLCLSPLAIETFRFNLVGANPPEDPFLSIVGYQWLSVMVALMVVPSTLMTPRVFDLIGPSGTCVFGNVFTGVLTIILLVLGNLDPTRVTFAFFVFFMYGGFPFTVFSQLTTGPMLDVLAPEDKIGFVQGLNNSAMNFGMAIAPWMFGLLADATSTNTAIWTGIGVSFGAALINTPLIWRPEMGPTPKKVPSGLRVLEGDEDPEAVEKALAGEFVPPDILFSINRKRILDHKQRIVPAVKTYQEEKDNLSSLRQHALEEYKFRSGLHDRMLMDLGDPNSETDTQKLCELYQSATVADEVIVNERTAEVGKWVGDYLLDNGYHPHMTSLLIKQMVMTAFPSLTREKEFTPDNIEEYILRAQRVLTKYAEVEDQRRYTFISIMGTGTRPQFYS